VQSSGNPLQGQRQVAESGRRGLQRGGTGDTTVAGATPSPCPGDGTGEGHGWNVATLLGWEENRSTWHQSRRATLLGRGLLYSGVQK